MKYVLLLATLLTAASAFAEEPSSTGGNDTYNFYFQKAPGPVTVNQGVRAAAPAEAPAPAAAAPAANGNVVAAVPETESDPRSRWKLYLGYSTTGEGATERPWMRWADDQVISDSGQYVAGLEFEVIKKVLAIQAEGRYLKKVPEWIYKNTQSKLDWAAGLVATPLRLELGRGAAIALSAMGGVIQMPYQGREQAVYNNQPVLDATLAHTTTPYFGARASLELFQKVALEANMRKSVKFDSTVSTFTLGFLL